MLCCALTKSWNKGKRRVVWRDKVRGMLTWHDGCSLAANHAANAKSTSIVSRTTRSEQHEQELMPWYVWYIAQHAMSIDHPYSSAIIVRRSKLFITRFEQLGLIHVKWMTRASYIRWNDSKRQVRVTRCVVSATDDACLSWLETLVS